MGLVNRLYNKLETKIQQQNAANQGPVQQQQSYHRPNAPPPFQAPAPQPAYRRPAMPPPASAGHDFVGKMQALSIDSSKGDLFSQIDTSQPQEMFQTAAHPVSLPGTAFEDFAQRIPLQGPVETNSFYTNMLLDNRTAPIWTHPYSLWYTNKEEETEYFGLAIAHTTKEQRVYGQSAQSPNETQYFFNPAGIKSFVISSTEFDKQMDMAIDHCEKFSCGINLFKKGSSGYVRVPAIQGMGFITAIYNNLTPVIASAVGIARFEEDNSYRSDRIKKYKVTLFDQKIWSMYVLSNVSASQVNFQLQSPNRIVGNLSDCTVQLCSGYHQAYDVASGGYPTACMLSGETEGDKATYKFKYQIEGTNEVSVFYALPHHIDSFTSEMRGQICQGLFLDSTIAGSMQAVVTNQFSMMESLPSQIGFQPWTSIPGVKLNSYSSSSLASIRKACLQDISDDVLNISNTDSMYSSGKILDKYAMVLYVITFILKDHNMGREFLPKVKDAMARFTTNSQQCPLVYETTWKGLVSSAGLDGNIFKDFGNTHYNDHHFHYGYHIHAAAVLSLCDNAIGDGSFLQNNRKYINFLVKDVANPVKDQFFPEFRSFDWFNGHSWAKGLFASFDGKDEESSSEDYHFAYGLKLWGQVIGDKNMENRGNLMLAVMRRSMNMYMLYKDSNKVQPPEIIKNKVSGILFENKIDHATYFGLNLEYIQGIHMLPITPISSYIRDAEFVREEWEGLLANHVKTLNDGWKGILMLNLALYKPTESWAFFNDPRFDKRWLDNGMSLSWCLAFIAGVGGAV